MIFVGSGLNLMDGGWQAGAAARGDYFRHRYHQLSDEWKAGWDFSGSAAYIDVVYQLGDELANRDIWPNWHSNSMFRAIRDKSAAGRQ